MIKRNKSNQRLINHKHLMKASLNIIITNLFTNTNQDKKPIMTNQLSQASINQKTKLANKIQISKSTC
jgi:hypothetical protein